MLSSVLGARAVPEASEFIHLNNTWDLGSKPQNMRFLKGLLPGSSHGGIFHEELSLSLRNECAISHIFQPIATFGFVVEDLKVQSKCLTEEGGIVILEEPGSSLARNLSYRIEEDLQHCQKQNLHKCWVCWPFSVSR